MTKLALHQSMCTANDFLLTWHRVPVTAGYTNYYMTDPISRASVIMARCTVAGPPDLVQKKKEVVEPASELAQSRDTIHARAVANDICA